jgi:hypothetical protein
VAAKLVGLLMCVCCGFLGLAPPTSGEVLTLGTVRIHSTNETYQYCYQQGDITYFSFPGTRPWALLDDERVYHPMPTEVVVEAVSSIEYPIEGIEIDILILPAVRRDLPKSSAEGPVIFLSPGRVPYRSEHVHYTVAHEIGHIVQHSLMPRSRQDLWQAYAGIRGLSLSELGSSGEHAWRMSEIFAEDFRVLFGGSHARCGGEVENHDITPPEDVEGLREFMLSLLEEWAGKTRVTVSPNPFQSSVVLRVLALDEGVDLGQVTVFNVMGRRLRRLEPAPGSRMVAWDGRDEQGRPAAPGIYLLAVRSGHDLDAYKVLKAAP